MEDNEIIKGELPGPVSGSEPEKEEPQGNHKHWGTTIGLIAGMWITIAALIFDWFPTWGVMALPLGLVLGQSIDAKKK